MINQPKIEALAEAADAQARSASKSSKSTKSPRPYALRHTHKVNGIGIECIHRSTEGLWGRTARRFTEMFTG